MVVESQYRSDTTEQHLLETHIDCSFLFSYAVSERKVRLCLMF